MVAEPRIKTTVVGSYPVPDWLLALPSEQALMDATRVVIHTQEQAGIDLVCDGEFSRFDVNHPETNGMIEYFVRPMAGMRTAITFDEMTAYRSQRGMGFAPGRRRWWTPLSAPARLICHTPARAASASRQSHSSLH
jgi:5-methyltetrahydropteroyltriglutamate--homocysteine methyltransferase